MVKRRRVEKSRFHCSRIAISISLPFFLMMLKLLLVPSHSAAAFVVQKSWRRPRALVSHRSLIGRWMASTTSLSTTEQSNQTTIPPAVKTAPQTPIIHTKETSTNKQITYLEEKWREHPDLNRNIQFKSWVVPVSGKAIHTILNSAILQPYLATRHELLNHMHLRFKLVRDFPGKENSNQREKLILLHPDVPNVDKLPANVQQLLRAVQVQDVGPLVPIEFNYQQFTASYILNKLLPAELHPPPTAFETVGHVAHLNLRQCHLPYSRLIGQVLLETLPLIETVIHKVGEVSGPYRTYDFAVSAGRPDTLVSLTESGIQLDFDLAEVYWCSRLSEERQRLLRNEFQPGQIVADAFCGVGALCLLAAQQLNCTIWANDWNPKAIEYLNANVNKNGVYEKFTKVQCGDAYDFLMDLGLQSESGDECHQRLPDHVVMNYPLEAPKFLGALRWWPVSKKDTTVPRVHVYTFARADPETDRTAEDVAVDLVASNLLPLGDSIKRLSELNDEYDCQVSVHPVRDVAPGKLVLCVSFSATPKLLRHVQGDFR